MRIRVLLPLIIVVLAVSCQSTPTAEESDEAPAAGVPDATPDVEALEALVAELRHQNRELARRVEASGDALKELEATLGTAVAPEETNLSQQELLGRARALRQENQALRRVIDELLYLDTLGRVGHGAPDRSEAVPNLPPGTLAGRREGTPPEAPTEEDTLRPAEEAPAVPSSSALPETPAVASPPAATRSRSDGFLETELLAVPPSSTRARQRPPLGEVIQLRLVDDSRPVYVDRRANFLSESPIFLAMEPAGDAFELTFWGVARYPGDSPPLQMRSIVVLTESDRYLFETREGELRRYAVRGRRVELFSQSFGTDHARLVNDITKADSGSDVTVTFVGSRESRSYTLSQPDRDAILNLVYAHRAAGGRLP
jgi:hypothetical protein